MPARRVANPIAIRRYAVEGEPGREVVLTIGKPRPWRADWACSVLIEGIEEPRRRRIAGVDAMQALQMAMVYARQTLDGSGLRLIWLDGEPGDVGLPPVTGCWGYEFQRKLERHMEREVARMNDAVATFTRLKQRRRVRRAESSKE